MVIVVRVQLKNGARDFDCVLNAIVKSVWWASVDGPRRYGRT